MRSVSRLSIPEYLKGKTYRTITISLKNQIQRKEVKERLLSEDGKENYRRRKTDVESVYGQIKQNQHFRRFHLRGLSKTTVEWGSLRCAQF
jgi:hypothetical protein